jgi:hypothetical protein
MQTKAQAAAALTRRAAQRQALAIPLEYLTGSAVDGGHYGLVDGLWPW